AIATLALQDVEDLLQARDTLHQLLERRAGHRGAVQAAQHHVPGPALDEIVLEARLVLQVLLRAAALHAIERRLGDEEVPALDQLLEVAIEEREQQRPDVCAGDVRIAPEAEP